jgi:Rod binding domain-containing protein
MNKTIFFNVSFKSMKQVLYKIKINETISQKKKSMKQVLDKKLINQTSFFLIKLMKKVD